MLRRETMATFGSPEVVDAPLPGKVSKHKSVGTVPQTDTGGHVEKTKALRELR